MVVFFFYITLYFRIYLMTKIIMKDKTLPLSELLYILISGLTLVIIHAATVAVTYDVHMQNLIISPILFSSPFLGIYLYAYKLNAFRPVFIVTVLVVGIISMTDYVLTATFTAFIQGRVTANMIPEMYANFFFDSPAFTLFSLVVMGTLTAFAAIPLYRKLQQSIFHNQKKQDLTFWAALAVVVLYLLFRMVLSRGLGLFPEYDNDPNINTDMVLLNAVSFLPYVVGLIFFARLIRQKYETQKEYDKKQSLEQYMSIIEQKHHFTKKFKHDYVNILTSLEYFIQANDMPGLKEYYENTVRKTTSLTAMDLADTLEKLHIPELKSIIASKLITAQNMGIDVSYETNQDVHQIAIDPVNMVRVMGIFLDNAIEAQEQLEIKTIVVGCFQWGNITTLIVQNACRADLADIADLKKINQSGFSTKGEGRGLGLANVQEIVNATPNLKLETNISNNYFTQMLTIGALNP